MKDGTKYATKLKRFCSHLRQEYGAQDLPELTNPTEELVVSCLSMYTTESRGKTALAKLLTHFVDINELRVGRKDEVMDVLGKSFPHSAEVTEMILGLLGAVYENSDDMDMLGLREGGKRDAKGFLESLNGISAYAVARVMLLSLGAHAFPVHPHMLTMLQKEDVAHPEATVEEAQSFLERHISATEALEVYCLMRYHCDHFKVSGVKLAAKKTSKKSSGKKSQTKKS